MDFHVDTDLQIEVLNSALGYWLWNLAVVLAPYDTGNLRRSITMSANSDTHKKYVYNTMNAMYLDYLERGIGPIKKHMCFIEHKTVGRFVEEIIDYFKVGKNISLGKPTVTLQISKQGAMFYEKKILHRMGLDDMELDVTADDRKYMSRFEFGTKHRMKYEKNNVRGSERARVRRLYKMNDRLLRWGDSE